MTEEELRRELDEAHKALDRFRAVACDEQREYDGVVYQKFRKWSLAERIENLNARSYGRGYNAAKRYGLRLHEACENAAEWLNKALAQRE